MKKLKSDDKLKPAPKNRVSVLFILSLAVILAIIGVSSWSFFGKQTRHTPPVSTASTAIDSPVAIPLSPSDDHQEMEAAPETTLTPTPDKSKKDVKEAAPTEPENLAPGKITEVPAPTVSESDILDEVDEVQKVFDGPADEPILPSETVTADADSSPIEADPSPEPAEETSLETEAISEPAPIMTNKPVTTSNAQEDMPTSDGEAPYSETGSPSDLNRETSAPVTEKANDTTLNNPTEDTDIETSGQREASTPTISPVTEDETSSASEKAQRRENGETETLPQADITSAPNETQSLEESVEAESNSVEEIDVSAKTAAEETLPSWQKYSAEFDAKDQRPRIAIVISDAGINSSRTREAIKKLPSAVTFGFNPYGQKLQELTDLARAAGHEVLLQLPMEPLGYPNIDPGPQAMRTDLNASENLARLDWALNRFSGYAGVTNQMGSKFTSDADSIGPVLEIIKENGVYFLDSRTASSSKAADIARDLNIPVAINHRFLDHKAVGEEFDARLAELESISRQNGSAIGIAYPYGETFRRLSDWAKSLDQKGIVLAPVSAIIKGKKEL